MLPRQRAEAIKKHCKTNPKKLMRLGLTLNYIFPSNGLFVYAFAAIGKTCTRTSGFTTWNSQWKVPTSFLVATPFCKSNVSFPHGSFHVKTGPMQSHDECIVAKQKTQLFLFEETIPCGDQQAGSFWRRRGQRDGPCTWCRVRRPSSTRLALVLLC